MGLIDVDLSLQRYFERAKITKPQDLTLDYNVLRTILPYEGIDELITDYNSFKRRVFDNLRMISNSHDNNPYTLTLINYTDNKIKIKDIRGIDTKRLINIDCIVRKVYEVKQEIYIVEHVCNICGKFLDRREVILGDTRPLCKEIMKNCPPHEKMGKPIINPANCIYKDVQRVIVQELRSEYGKQPYSIELVCTGTFCDKLTAGNRCIITGIVSIREESDGLYKQVLEVCNIEKTVDDYTDITLSEEDIHQIKELSQRQDIFELWTNSINPSIYGYDTVKLALTLQMFGGVTITYDDGSHQRGDSHILLCGDPSMAKSQLIRSISAIVPRGVYASGKSTSGAGLTASAMRDSADDKWYLEAGAMVLANGGMCIIDELDKMNDNDRSALHEAMESQTISVNKAGLSEKLDTVCSILASANPKGSKFDRTVGGSFMDQVDLPASLLSRFDLIFLLYDNPDAETDRTVANHVLEVRTKSTEGKLKRPLSIEIMRKYITYAKQINPILSEETKQILQQTYVDLRKRPDSYITVRQLEALERLSESCARVRLREYTTDEDARMAISLFTRALHELTLSDTVDVSILYGTTTKRQDGIEAFIYKFLKSCEYSKDQLIRSVSQVCSYSAREIEETIDILTKSGKINVRNDKLFWMK